MVDELIKITDKAAAQLRELMKEEDDGAEGLRIRVFNGGCSGLRYQLAFEETPAEDDEVIESNGIKVFVDPESLKYVRGLELDYTETISGQGFRITNPGAVGGCGCR
jgi:iron-sulfur cluster assembly protein